MEHGVSSSKDYAGSYKIPQVIAKETVLWNNLHTSTMTSQPTSKLKSLGANLPLEIDTPSMTCTENIQGQYIWMPKLRLAVWSGTTP